MIAIISGNYLRSGVLSPPKWLNLFSPTSTPRASRLWPLPSTHSPKEVMAKAKEPSQWALKLCIGSESKLNLRSLPREMWINVFESMESSSDLLKVVLTCKYFYSLAIRVLYRNIHWLGPFFYTQNVSFWKNHAPSVVLAPTSLTMAICLVNQMSYTRHDPTVGIVEEDGSWTVMPGAHHSTIPPPQSTYRNPHFSKKLTFYASQVMYDAILKRVSSFTKLRELVFHLSELPDTIFSTIKLLPCLKNLSIQYCTLPAIDLEPDPSFSELPLTELTLWFNKGEPDTVSKSNWVYTLYLCTAKNLRTLRVDWTSTTGRFLSQRNPIAPIAPLRTLTEVAIRFPPGKLWLSDEDEKAANDPLTAFLLGSPSIERFSCVNRRFQFRFPATVLSKLNFCCGGAASVVGLLNSRPVEHVQLSDVERDLAGVVHTLQKIARLKPHLQTLSFSMHKWDEEILYALVDLFADVRKLRIKFTAGFIQEQSLLSLGARFLYRFPQLETLQLYQIPSPSPDAGDHHASPLSRVKQIPHIEVLPRNAPADDDDAVKEFLSAWRRSCPSLRQVQLTERFVWRRAFNGDEWCKRPAIPSASKISELS
ncbi:hypothetical protein D9615_006254 [Tricholomella constricta]|uniref:F-box domain-containing protein n=1 Tax=Tricholomella constricta TaxID=117010 RepID=A0A8H5M445_9AGAR|nr:hypothetical protein D9615_006254 [Tricholomella constricta]